MSDIKFTEHLKRACRENKTSIAKLPEDLNREILEEIYHKYIRLKPQLTKIGEFIVNNLLPSRLIHSVRFRIKDEQHLLSKLIRKRFEDPSKRFTAEGLIDQVRDLIGVRILYLFKSQHNMVDRRVKRLFDIVEGPICYQREGDPAPDIADAEVKIHHRGYRSTHYIISLRPLKLKVHAELQTRTLNEEAWSEVDHWMLYPNNTADPILENFSLVLNGLSGTSDALTTLLEDMKSKLDEFAEAKEDWEFEREQHNDEMDELKKQISSSDMSPETKDSVIEKINQEAPFSFATYYSSLFDNSNRLGKKLAETMKTESFSEAAKRATDSLKKQKDSTTLTEALKANTLTKAALEKLKDAAKEAQPFPNPKAKKRKN